jgi:hypothetical protein
LILTFLITATKTKVLPKELNYYFFDTFRLFSFIVVLGGVQGGIYTGSQNVSSVLYFLIHFLKYEDLTTLVSNFHLAINFG